MEDKKRDNERRGDNEEDDKSTANDAQDNDGCDARITPGSRHLTDRLPSRHWTCLRHLRAAGNEIGNPDNKLGRLSSTMVYRNPRVVTDCMVPWPHRGPNRAVCTHTHMGAVSTGADTVSLGATRRRPVLNPTGTRECWVTGAWLWVGGAGGGQVRCSARICDQGGLDWR
jgi:hypothetical protein